jgi:hypothetical protein
VCGWIEGELASSAWRLRFGSEGKRSQDLYQTVYQYKRSFLGNDESIDSYEMFRQTNWEGMVRRVIADTERYAETKCVKRINKNDNLEQRDARRQKYLEEMQANPDDHRHGTPYGYNNVGCRCNRCRDATNVDQRNRRAAKFITELEKQAQ